MIKTLFPENLADIPMLQMEGLVFDIHVCYLNSYRRNMDTNWNIAIVVYWIEVSRLSILHQF